MFATHPAAPPWTCLRCQIHQCLTQSGGMRRSLGRVRHPLARLSSSEARQDSPLYKKVLSGSGNGDEHGHERYGEMAWRRPSRDLQPTYERLKIDSLDKPSEVIVLRDSDGTFTDRPRAVHLSRNPRMNPDEIALAIEKQEVEPSKAEIHASINALRPHDTALLPEEFDGLAKRLTEGYTVAQLTDYVTQHLGLHLTGKNTVLDRPRGGLPRNHWMSGQTPIEKRHTVATKIKDTQIAKTKPKLAKQILQLVWHASLESENRLVGELELSLKPWQTTFLFDLTVGKKAMYQELLGSNLVLRVADIRPYRPHNIARITGRRQVAEEIASRMKAKLSKVSSLELDLSVFKPLLTHIRKPATVRTLFNERALRDVCSRTQSAIEWVDDETLVIYNLSIAGAASTRRLLVSLLELPSRRHVKSASMDLSTVGMPAVQSKVLPETLHYSVHARHRHQQLSRLGYSSVASSMHAGRHSGQHSNGDESKSYENDELRSSFHLGKQLGDEMSAVKTSFEAATRDSAAESYWVTPSQLTPMPWVAQICRIVQRDSDMEALRSSGLTSQTGRTASLDQLAAPSEVQPQFPGMTALLSYFSPLDVSSESPMVHDQPLQPHLLAHFVPSPFTSNGLDNLTRLPRIEMEFSLVAPPTSGRFQREEREVRLTGMTAVLEEQVLSVPLPFQTSDVQFSQSTKLYSTALDPHTPNDDELLKFVGTLRSSYQDDAGSLVGEPTTMLKLPAWLVHGSSTTEQEPDVPVEYMFERFEHVEAVDLVPIALSPKEMGQVHPAVQRMLSAFPVGAFLRYRAVEAGAVSGQWTELTIRSQSPSSTATTTTEVSPLALAETALHVTDVLSGINRQKTEPWTAAGAKEDAPGTVAIDRENTLDAKDVPVEHRGEAVGEKDEGD